MRTSVVRLVSMYLLAALAPSCGSDTRVDPDAADTAASFEHAPAPEPVITIGREDGAAVLRFNRIHRIELLPNEDLLVVNTGGPPALRIFDPSGEPVAAFGGQGDGPGEFVRLFDAWLVPPDTIVALDYGHMRVSRFLSDGTFLGDALLTHLAADQLIVRGRYEDGSWLLAANAPESDDRAEGRVTLRMLATAPADGSSVDSIGYFEEMTRPRSGSGFATPAFLPGVGTYAVIGDRLYAGYPDAFEIEVRSRDGAILHTIRRSDAGRPLTDELFEILAEQRIAAAPPERQAQTRRTLREAPRPEHLPAFSGALASDAEGNVWVQEFVVPGTTTTAWSVFDGGGAFLGDVQLPTAFTPMVITDARLIGVWRDELDVESVRVFEMNR